MNAMDTQTPVESGLRGQLSDFSSIVCFRALMTGIEKIMGRAAHGTLAGAGRMRGRDLVESLGLEGKGFDGAEGSMRHALGEDGTQLCVIEQIERVDDETVIVRLFDTVESASEPPGSDRRLGFTLGAVHGAVEALTGGKWTAKQTGSILQGDNYDEITLRAR